MSVVCTDLFTFTLALYFFLHFLQTCYVPSLSRPPSLLCFCSVTSVSSTFSFAYILLSPLSSLSLSFSLFSQLQSYKFLQKLQITIYCWAVTEYSGSTVLLKWILMMISLISSLYKCYFDELWRPVCNFWKQQFGLRMNTHFSYIAKLSCVTDLSYINNAFECQALTGRNLSNL